MAQKILQVNFRLNSSAADYIQAVADFADGIAQVPGLRWKIWTINEQEEEAGGIYLFEDAASLKAFLQGPLIAGVTKDAAFGDLSVKQFDVMEGTTAVTRGPI